MCLHPHARLSPSRELRGSREGHRSGTSFLLLPLCVTHNSPDTDTDPRNLRVPVEPQPGLASASGRNVPFTRSSAPRRGAALQPRPHDQRWYVYSSPYPLSAFELAGMGLSADGAQIATTRERSSPSPTPTSRPTATSPTTSLSSTLRRSTQRKSSLSAPPSLKFTRWTPFKAPPSGRGTETSSLPCSRRWQRSRATSSSRLPAGTSSTTTRRSPPLGPTVRRPRASRRLLTILVYKRNKNTPFLGSFHSSDITTEIYAPGVGSSDGQFQFSTSIAPLSPSLRFVFDFLSLLPFSSPLLLANPFFQSTTSSTLSSEAIPTPSTPLWLPTSSTGLDTRSRRPTCSPGSIDRSEEFWDCQSRSTTLERRR